MKLVLRCALAVSALIYNLHAHAVCTVSAVPLAFGNYDTFRAAPTDSTGNIAVTCSGPVGAKMAYTIALFSARATGATRQMRSPAGGALTYSLYVDPARSTVWGDGSSNTKVVADGYTLTAPSISRNYPVYGRIPGRQNAVVGVYSDTVQVSVDF